MHSLFEKVLTQRNLSKAGDLFSLEDHIVIQNLRYVLPVIRDVAQAPDFTTNHNDQSLVEICITRLTSAIRETKSIEDHAEALVELLETCLNYNLRPVNNGPDPPHAKIASDVMSCLFMNYGKKNVMRLALPVSVKFLHKGNKDLSKNMSSYLSLAAIENAELLAQHIQPIIDSVISGNYSLARVLPQIYSVNRDPIKSHVMTLVSILHPCDNNEKLALLTVFSYVAKENPALLEPSIPQLCDGLTSQATAHSTIQVFCNMAMTRPQPLADHTNIIKRTGENFPKTALASIQLMCLIAKTNQEKGQEALDFVISIVGRLEDEKHSIVLKEVLSLTNRYPSCLTINVVNKLSALEDHQTSSSSMRACIQELRNNFNSSVRTKERSSSTSSSGVTIVKVGGNYGSKGELSYKTGSRHEISALRNAVASVRTNPTPEVIKTKIESRSTGRLPTHRSMTRLNNFDVRAPSSGGLNKSLSKLTSSQQNMARSSSQVVATPTSMSNAPTARSVTCINNNRMTGFGGPSSLTTAASMASGGYISGRVTISTGPGASSPTKSMSSGSMSGVVQEREIVTVNVNQINEDLIRQVGAVSNSVNTGPASVLNSNSYLQGIYNPLPTSNLQGRRVPPYSSGPLPTASTTTSQPPSLVLPTTTSTTTPMGPLLPLSAYDLGTKYGLSSGISQPLSSDLGGGGGGGGGTSRAMAANHAIASMGGPIPSRRSNFSNTLPSPRRRQQMKELLEQQASSKDDSSGVKPQSNRMSVFEPYPMRDTVQHFCEKHLEKIKSYMESLMVKLPLPVKCTVEERKGRRFAKLHFACQGRSGEHCLYNSTFYTIKTRNPRTYIHLMFLALQSRAPSALSTREASVSALKNCWEILKCEAISFVTLVTGAFPPPKAQDNLMHELRSHRFFDVFEYNGPRKIWGCFLCNHPDRAVDFVQDQEPVIEGQLKEKKGGRWSIFKKWKSRYFTLSGDKLTYKDTPNTVVGAIITQTLDVGSIRSVKVTKEGRRNIPKAFEIFTEDRTFILKAKDGSNAQEWVQCLSVAKAHSQAKDTNLKKLAYGGSLGRLNHHHHGRPPLHHSSLNTNLASLRTAV